MPQEGKFWEDNIKAVTQFCVS